MRGEREVVLVTGSAGLIGGPLVERLAERFTLVGFDRKGLIRHPHPVAECVRIEITDPDRLARVMQRVEYAYGSAPRASSTPWRAAAGDA